MLVVLPFAALLLLMGLCRSCEPDWRQSALSAAVAWGMLLCALTEGLSLARALTPGMVAAAWSLIVLGLTVAIWRHPPPGAPKAVVRAWPLMDRVLLGGVGLIVLGTGVIAILAPPNTWDAMTYHMSRVMQWRQNAGVDHYPTHTPMQLYRNPWTEYVHLHLHLLSGGDRFANCVQWAGMVAGLLATSLLARQLGGGTRSQILAAVGAATLPIGILQSTSTQTDYAGAGWLLCLASYTLQARAENGPRPRLPTILKIGASLGLALLTKASNYLYVLPFLAWLVFTFAHRDRRASAAWLPLAAVVATLVVLPWAWRNADLYGSPIGPTGGDLCEMCRLTNEAWTPPLLVSTVSRNIAIHLGTPWDSLNGGIQRGIEGLHAAMGLVTSDTRVTWLGYPFRVLPPLFNEDLDGNPLHLVLIIGSIIAVGLSARAPLAGVIRAYTVAVTAAFFLLCLTVKWNPFNTRLHLPLFLLWMPIVAVTAVRARHAWLAPGIGLMLLVAALPWLLFNSHRPLLLSEYGMASHARYLRQPPNLVTVREHAREQLYFAADPRLEREFREAVEVVKRQGCGQIGLIKGWDDWEYPLWPLLGGGDWTGIRIRHVSVGNPSAVLGSRAGLDIFVPCAIIKVGEGRLTVSLPQAQRDGRRNEHPAAGDTIVRR